MRISRRSLLFGIGSAWLIRAQDADFSAGVNVVTLLATVRDRDGRVIKNLNRDDFVLEEDGKPQNITYFSRESDLPLALGLLVDTSRSQIGVLEPERKASYAFLNQMLREDKDVAFIARFDTQVRVLQGFTSSRQELAAALDQLAIPGQFATLIYEAIRSNSENMMRKREGRKAFILLSDGVSFRDQTTLGTAIEYAQRADTIIFSIRYADHPKFYRPGRAAVEAFTNSHGKGVLQRLSRETGGEYFDVTASQPIEKTYAEIEDLLRNQYSIGYTPQSPGKPGVFHKIKLTVKQPGLIVQTRDGYFSRERD
jgi:Ca-activated chloride channel family protein